MTDEKAPKADDFAVLISRAWAPPTGAALVFNCQMGRGRTTTGMIIASLLHVQAISRPPNGAGEAWHWHATQLMRWWAWMQDKHPDKLSRPVRCLAARIFGIAHRRKCH